MTDRELLERAFSVYAPGENYIRMINTAGSDYWNPLHDDGAALRLAAKLRLTVGDDDQSVRPVAFAYAAHLDMPRCYEPSSADAAAAYRRAIVRAAAAMAPK